jgi:hypothetical protein
MAMQMIRLDITDPDSYLSIVFKEVPLHNLMYATPGRLMMTGWPTPSSEQIQRLQNHPSGAYVITP